MADVELMHHKHKFLFHYYYYHYYYFCTQGIKNPSGFRKKLLQGAGNLSEGSGLAFRVCRKDAFECDQVKALHTNR